MKTYGSNFTSIAGLAVLAVLILVSAYFRITALAVFLGAVLLLCALSFLWARFSLRRIEVKMDCEDACAFPGETIEVGALLQNRKFLPLLWLDLSFPNGGHGCVAPLTDAQEEEPETEITESFAWIMPQQKLFWRQRAMAVHRGVCAVESVSLRSGDGFGLSEQACQVALPGRFRFVVYPKILPVDASLILHNMREMEKAKNGFYEDKTLLRSTREYRAGDSFKDINWRLMARTDEVQVNIRETLAMKRVCFIPDMQSFCYEEEEYVGNECRIVTKLHAEEMERMFSLMASLVLSLQERDVLCTMVIPSIGERAASFVIPETGETQVMELLTAMAEVDYDRQKTVLPVEEIQNEHHKLGQIYIFSYELSTALGAEDAEFADSLGAIRVIQRGEELSERDRGIFKESDLLRI